MAGEGRGWRLLLPAAALLSQAAGDAWLGCPVGWSDAGGGASCYRLERRPREWAAAAERCERLGGRLLALTSAQEERRLLGLLESSGGGEREWLTGGVRRGGAWEWSAEGPLHRARWAQDGPRGDHIALRRGSDGWEWAETNASAALPFVCEAKRAQLSRVRSLARPVEDFGAAGERVRSALRAPRIVQGPRSQVHYGAAGPQPWAVLRCRAVGNPRPRITWLRGSSGGRLSLASSPRLLAVGGRLVVRRVAAEDADSYTCLASNRFGSVRSPPAHLRLAFMREFPSSRLDVYAQEGAGQRLPCEEPDHFPRSVGFGWMTGSIKDFVDEDQRVFHSQDGSLYFASVRAEDEASYACNVVQHELQSGSYGPFFRLKVELPSEPSSLASPPTIPPEFPKLFPRLPQLRSTVRLECFAYGHPAPSFHWEWQGSRELPSSAELDQWNRTLSLHNLDASSAGLFKCVAENSQGEDWKQFLLEPQYPPSLSGDGGLEGGGPVSEGGEVAFVCPVVPGDVEVEWFRDAKPLSPILLSAEDSRRFSFTGTHLRIKPLKTVDRGVYQCVGRNELGAVSASAYLPVPLVRPSFAKTAARTEVRAAAAAAVRLGCEAEAGPEAGLSWAKDGAPLGLPANDSAARRRQLPDGDLFIAALREEDGGTYLCSAANDLGTDDSDLIHLSVAQPLALRLFPPRLQLPPHRRIQLRCKVDGALCSQRTGCVTPSFAWEQNGELVNGDSVGVEVRDAAELGESTLTIAAALPRHCGVYVCRADSALGRLSATSSVSVASVPLPPLNVSATLPEPQTVQLAFRMPTHPSGPFHSGFDRFQVQARTNFSTDWRTVQEVNAVHPVVEGLSLAHLTPGTKYRFRVLAHNSVGWGLPSLPSEEIETFPGRPSGSVTNLRLRRPRPGLLLLSWEPLDRESWGGGEVGYLVEWEESGGEGRTAALGDPLARHFALPSALLGNSSCPRLSVRVFAFNSEGRGSPSALGPVPVPVLPPDTPVRDLRASTLSATVAGLSWVYDFNASNSSCDATKAFLVSCSWAQGHRSLLFPANPHHVVLTNSTTSLNGTVETHLFNVSFTELPPQSRASCQVFPMTEDGTKGPGSEEVSVPPSPRAPSEAPRKLRVWESWERPESSVQVSWWPSRLAAGSLWGYRLRVWAEDALSWQSLDVGLGSLGDPSAPLVRLSGLRPLQLVHLAVAELSEERQEGPYSQPSPYRIGASAQPPPLPTHLVSSSPLVLPSLSLLCLAAAALLVLRR